MKAMLLLLSTLALAACATNTAGIYASSQGENRADNVSFGRKLSMEDVRAYGEGGQLAGQVTLRSHTSTDQTLQYRFTWYDGNNSAVDADNSRWVPVTVHGFQRLQVKSVAPNATAQWFDINVRAVVPN